MGYVANQALLELIFRLRKKAKERKREKKEELEREEKNRKA